MKLRKITVPAALAVVALGISAGTVNAAPAVEPAQTDVHYEVTRQGDSAVLTTTDGVLKTVGDQLVLTAADGAPVPPFRSPTA